MALQIHLWNRVLSGLLAGSLSFTPVVNARNGFDQWNINGNLSGGVNRTPSSSQSFPLRQRNPRTSVNIQGNHTPAGTLAYRFPGEDFWIPDDRSGIDSNIDVDGGSGGAGGNTGGNTGGSGGSSGGGSMAGLAIVAGVIAVAAITHALAEESGTDADQPQPDDQSVQSLKQQGPQLPPLFNMSAFAIRGLVKGGWPLVVDYNQGSSGPVRLLISSRGADIVTYDLDPIGPGRHLIKFRLPDLLGNSVQPALVALLATTGTGGRDTQRSFRIYALGVGPRAVGSAAIEQLDFNPEEIRVRRNEAALYRFYSRSDFDNLAVEFLQVQDVEDGSHHRYVDRELIPGGAQKNRWVGQRERRDWDGRDEREQVSPGAHKLQVRAWDDGGSWIGAWSDATVEVLD